MNKSMLRSFMVLYGDTNRTLADFLSITEQSLCNKINGNGTEFRQGEIRRISLRYRLSAEQIEAIFFS